MDAFWLAANAHNWEQPEVKQEFRLYMTNQETCCTIAWKICQARL
jgi:hypothetical protein